MCFMPTDQPLPGLIPETRRRSSVTKTDRTEPESGNSPTAKRGSARRTRGIRFSDSEWEEVKAAAELHDVPAAEFVRKTILDIARSRADTSADTISASLTPLIERTFRYTWMLATHRRDELIREGRGEELEKLANAAQELQGQIQSGASS